MTPEIQLFLGRCVTALKARGIRAKGTASFSVLVGRRESAIELHPFFQQAGDAGVLEQLVQQARELEDRIQSTALNTYFDTYLYALDKCCDVQGVLGEEWVVHPPNPDYGYHSTPRNALTFGAMGVDGVHYAILAMAGVVRDASPVIQVSPMDSSDIWVLVDSFLSFLADGCGVAVSKMEAVFAAEQKGENSLVAFLKQNFDMSRFWDERRSQHFPGCLELIEKRV